MSHITKVYLDDLVKKYETKDFIDKDPVQFPHMFSRQQDIEISALIASALAYGQRKNIIKTVKSIHEIFDYKPYDFVLNFDLDRDATLFSGFIYRYTKELDIILLVSIISQALKQHETLEKAFMLGYSETDFNIRNSLDSFVELLRSYLPNSQTDLKGVYHLIPNPQKGSACKRLNLFLKWMTRRGPVDLNLWKNIPQNKLIMPLDTHVARVSREWDLTSRKTNDWKTAEEITEKLKAFDPDDPVKYDFAIFGTGVD